MSETRHGYRIVGPVGAGALTIVESAESPEGRKVALKRARPDARLAKQALLTEAQALGRLAHPNVVLFLGTVGGNADPHLVLELVEGETLRAVLDRRLRLPVSLAVHIAHSLALALAHLERHGVVHGDLSPSNVMLSREGTVRLLDFGSARVEGASEAALRNARARLEQGTLLATPAYTAPERLLGEPGDARSDLFSLGVLLYEMLSGRKPWDSGSEATSRGKNRKLVPLRSRQRDVPAALESLVHALLAKNPADRPAHAREVADTLAPRALGLTAQELADDLFGSARPAGTREQLPLRELAKRYVAVGVAFVVLAIALRALLGETRHDAFFADPDAPPARLRVVARPWAEVWIDGELRATTPFAAPIALRPGLHTLTLRHPLGGEDEREIMAEEGQEMVVKKEFTLPAAPAKPHDDDTPAKREKL